MTGYNRIAQTCSIAPTSKFKKRLPILSMVYFYSLCRFFMQVIFLMMREMLRFGTVLFVVVLGFTLSFHALFRTDDTFGRTSLNLFKAMLGEVGFFDEISEARYENRYKSVATVLLVAFLIIITIVLLNLLIAVLSTKHAEVQEHADKEYRVLKARLIKHYRFVVQNDLLPAPFNLVQLPFRWHEGAKRRVGYVAFWLVAGFASVVGGGLLWMVSALLIPFPRVPSYGQVVPWAKPSRRGVPERLSPKYPRVSKGVEFIVLLSWRFVLCPVHLLGWWLTQILVCDCCRPEIAGGVGPSLPVRVDEMLEEANEPSVKHLLKFLIDPLSDDKVREDERKKATTVEHIKLLRYRLESHIDRTVERQMDALHEEIKEVGDRLKDLGELISQAQGQRRRQEASP